MATETTKCPVCGHDAVYDYAAENIGTVEYRIFCNTCGYCEAFAYGSYIEIVGRKEFVWSWNTKPDNPIFRRMKRAVFMAKRNWRKRKKGKTK